MGFPDGKVPFKQESDPKLRANIGELLSGERAEKVPDLQRGCSLVKEL